MDVERGGEREGVLRASDDVDRSGVLVERVPVPGRQTIFRLTGVADGTAIAPSP